MRSGQHGRVVAQVGIHLDDDRGAPIERDREPVEIGAAEALLGRAVADADARVGRRRARRRVSPVPSGEPSSTTSSVAPGRASRMAADTGRMLSASS